MNRSRRPHFLLLAESHDRFGKGYWRFDLADFARRHQISASDSESHLRGERLALLAVVRGLEALPEPSEVTLLTNNRSVRQGLNYGLAEWRENGFCWECFGEMRPINNADLWRRIDRALQFHRVDCRHLRSDLAHGAPPAPHVNLAQPELVGSAAMNGGPQQASPADATLSKAKSSAQRAPGSTGRGIRRLVTRGLRGLAKRIEALDQNSGGWSPA